MVEERIAAFWDMVDQLPPDGLLSAADLGQWARNLIERDASSKILVRDFRLCAAAMQRAIDYAGSG